MFQFLINNLYNETVSYDMNNNILSLQRNAKGISRTAEQIDNLAYTGNRLNTVTDNSSNYAGYPDTSGTLINYDDSNSSAAVNRIFRFFLSMIRDFDCYFSAFAVHGANVSGVLKVLAGVAYRGMIWRKMA
jgi:hypothetical protein